LVKVIVEHNPKQECYLEESLTTDAIYPYLSPHGLIFKLNHEPLSALPVTEMDADRAFWSKQFAMMLGDWLKRRGHDVLTVAAGTDEGLKRPLPLQIVVDKAGGYRLYAQRHYVHFSR